MTQDLFPLFESCFLEVLGTAIADEGLIWRHSSLSFLC